MMVDNTPNAKDMYSYFVSKISKSAPHTFQYPRHQNFSLPSPIISNIFYQKESLSILIKIYQTCKYFIKKRFILPVVGSITCNRTSIFTSELYAGHNFNKNVLFWFYNELFLTRTCKTVRERIYCCNIQKLGIFYLIITFDEFKHIISNSFIEDFALKESKIIFSNGSIVPFNAILQNLPYLTKINFQIRKEMFTKETLLAMNEIIFFNKFIRLYISIISVCKEFNAEMLWKFVKKNFDSASACYLTSLFYENVKDKRFKEMLKTAFKSVFYDWDGKNPKIIISK